jgi:hypothetical protein
MELEGPFGFGRADFGPGKDCNPNRGFYYMAMVVEAAYPHHPLSIEIRAFGVDTAKGLLLFSSLFLNRHTLTIQPVSDGVKSYDTKSELKVLDFNARVAVHSVLEVEASDGDTGKKSSSPKP